MTSLVDEEPLLPRDVISTRRFHANESHEYSHNNGALDFSI